MRIFWLVFMLFSVLPSAVQAQARAVLLADQGRAAVRIELEPGWKTYWRMPGESGVSPQFDWSGSENLESAEILYPAPRRFTDSEGETVGYAGGVVFPVVIKALDAARPVRLRLKLDYGVCKEICIPAKADLAVDAGQADAAAGQAIEEASARLPQKLEAGAVRLAVQADGLGISLRLPGNAAFDDVFAEGAPLAYFRAPRADASKNLVLPVDGMADVSLLRGTILTLTVTAGTSAYEIPAKIE